jgi:RHS repeat-associated protein
MRAKNLATLGKGINAECAEENSAEVAKSHVIGHDVIAQARKVVTNLVLDYLMVDGHGSTRALLDAVAAVTQKSGNNQLFAYDAYGNLIAGPGLVQQVGAALTSLLYSGEQTDGTGLQYLRARYYDPQSGRFNRLDPFAGNFGDPQSLHKYLYVHGDPINGLDPSGEKALSERDLDEAGIALRLAELAYVGSTSPFPPGWKSTGRLEYIRSIGFRAITVQNASTKELVVAFSGTDDLILAGEFGDWISNWRQGTGRIAAQYTAALAFAKEAKASVKPGWTLKFVGHSLGGGLASLAGVVNKVPTITFNPAPLHRRTLRRYGAEQEHLYRYVTSYQVQGEALTTAANVFGTSHLGFGIVYDLPAQLGLNAVGLHGVEAIGWGINNLRDSILRGATAGDGIHRPGHQGTIMRDLLRDTYR